MQEFIEDQTRGGVRKTGLEQREKLNCNSVTTKALADHGFYRYLWNSMNIHLLREILTEAKELNIFYLPTPQLTSFWVEFPLARESPKECLGWVVLIVWWNSTASTKKPIMYQHQKALWQKGNAETHNLYLANSYLSFVPQEKYLWGLERFSTAKLVASSSLWSHHCTRRFVAILIKLNHMALFPSLCPTPGYVFLEDRLQLNVTFITKIS